MALRLFDGKPYALRLSSHAEVENGGVYQGTVADVEGSSVVLAHVDDAVAGTVFIPGKGMFRVRTRPGGELHVTEIDSTAIPDEIEPIVPPPSAPTAADDDEPPTANDAAGGASGGTSAPIAYDANTVIDLMVAYTPLARQANGGTAGINALIQSSVATTNTAYQNSQVQQTLRLVHTTETYYSESGTLGTDLGRLANKTEGFMDELHATRNAVKADLVSLIVTGSADAAGVAYLWTPNNSSFVNQSFSVVLDSYADANLTLAHELGHNMGCNHGNGDGVGAYAYSQGYRFTAGGSTYRTVMAYAPGQRIPYFSNPSVNYLGTATGVTNSADNALTLNTSRTTIAALMSGLTAADMAWIPILTADLDANGQTDIVWRNADTGRVIAWMMNGTTRTSVVPLWSGDPSWVPIASGDFNADGKPDLIWRNSASGRVIAWLMNGTTMASSAVIWAGDAAWVPITVADFDADGKPDIVWRNANTGRVIVWIMNGTTATSYPVLWSGDPSWIPVAAGDMNGDNKPDIIWRNTSNGRVIVWVMNGTTATSYPVIWAGGGDWVPRAIGSFNGDSSPDIVWRNSSTGRVIVWMMSGTTMASTTAIWE